MIESTNLGKRFKRVWVLEDCTFKVLSGSLCALLGGHGAGKTTLLRMLSGLARPTTGTARINGMVPSGDDTEFLADIGYLAQEMPPNSLYHNRFDPLKFDTQNLMPVAFAVFALGVGVTAGALIRRSVPAIAATVGGFLATRLLVEVYVRPHYVQAVSLLSPLAAETAAPTGAWVLGSTLIGPTGRSIQGPFDPATVCPDALGRVSTAACLNRLGYHLQTTFQPAGRYWHFQWTEAGMFIAAGVALLVTAAVVTIRRDA